jgi:hypothetical protein
MRRILNGLLMLAVANVGVLAQQVVLPTPNGINTRTTIVEPPEKVANAVAIVLDVQGVCKISNDGQNFRPLKKSAELGEGVTIQTTTSGTADVFLKRMGTTVRLKPNSEITLNRTTQKKDQREEVNTVVNVRKGKMLTVVHANVPGSSLNIKNAAGKTLADAVAGGHYMVSADKIEKVSASKTFDDKTTAAIKDHMDIDELHALTETWKDSENPGSGK